MKRLHISGYTFFALLLSANLDAQTAPHVPHRLAVDPQAAVNSVSSDFAPNPLVKIAATGQPLPTTGSWSVQLQPEGELPAACRDAATTCARVLYRVPELGVTCSWLVAPSVINDSTDKKPATQILSILILDEDENAIRYTLRKRFSNEESHLRTVSHPAPVYPASLKNAQFDVTVVVRMIVDPDGHVRDAKVLSGPALLQQSARDAAMQWSFEPAHVGGHPVAFQTETYFHFKNGSSMSTDFSQSPLPSGTPSLHQSLQNTAPVH